MGEYLIKSLSQISIAFLVMAIGLSACSQPESEKPGETIDLLISNGTIVTMDAEFRVIRNGYIAVRGDRILAIGEMQDLEKQGYSAVTKINARERLIVPGLINAHTHIPMTLFRGIADDLRLQEWLEKYIFPAEAMNVDRDFVVAGTRLGLIEMIHGGTTTYVDMYYFEDAIAEETRHAGLRAVLGETVIDFPVADNKTWQEAIDYTDRFVKKWKNDSLITPAIAPHAPYTVSTGHLEEVSLIAKKHDIPIITHIAEASTETAFTKKNFKAAPVSYLDRIGFLSDRVIAAHVVHVDDSDIAILKNRGVGVVHCPQSNMKLSSGVSPVNRMLIANIRLGLGTDSASSNNDLSLWEEMDTAAKLHKLINQDPTVLNARQAFSMATIGGARAIHREKEIGSLESGKKADFIVLDTDAPHLIPRYNIYSHLVYATKASDVRDMVVNGRILMRDRNLLTLSEFEVKNAARRYQMRVAESLKNREK